MREKKLLTRKIYCSNCKIEFENARDNFRIKQFNFETPSLGALTTENKEILKTRMHEWHTLEEWQDLSTKGYTKKEEVYINALRGELPALQSTSSKILKKEGYIYREEEYGKN